MTEEKQRIAASLSPENVEWVDENYNNRSAFIDDLISRARMDDSELERVVAEYQLEQLRGEKKSVESRLDSINSQIERLEERLSSHDQHREDALEETLAEIEEYRLTVDADHQLVEKLGREQFGGDARAALDALIEYNEERADPVPEARFET